MTQVIIEDELAERLQEIAQHENRPVQEVLVSLLELYTARAAALDEMDGMFDDDVSDLSTTVRATLNVFFKGEHDRSG